MKEVNTCHIAFATDDNYAAYLSVAIQSIKETAVCKCEVYIMTDGLLPENEAALVGMSDEKIQVRIVDVSDKTAHAETFGLYYLTKSTYYRLYLTELLPDLDRILYLDCDVLVCRDLGDLYNAELGDCYVAACQDLGYRLPDWHGKEESVRTLAQEGGGLQTLFQCRSASDEFGCYAKRQSAAAACDSGRATRSDVPGSMCFQHSMQGQLA